MANAGQKCDESKTKAEGRRNRIGKQNCIFATKKTVFFAYKLGIWEKMQSNSKKTFIKIPAKGKTRYLCTDFLLTPHMTTKIGDTSFADLFASLRFQVECLKRRCTSAEQEAASLRQQLQDQQARIEELEKDNKEITEKYNGLQAGTATGASAEEIAKLRDRYLAMIREIDLCLSRLNG